jgi:hypothetical protein
MMFVLFLGLALQATTASADMICDEDGNCYPVDPVSGGKNPPPATSTPIATPTASYSIGPSGEILNQMTGSAVFSPEAQDIRNRKQALADEYKQVRLGNVSMSQYNTHLDTFLNSVGITETTYNHPDRLRTSQDCSSLQGTSTLAYASDGSCFDTTENFAPDADPGAPSPYLSASHERVILWNVPWIPQNNGYYCGPAAAMAVMKFWNKNKSFWGDTLSQNSMAARCTGGSRGCADTRGKYLMTDYFRETPWSYSNFDSSLRHYNMAYGLNRWWTGAEDGAYIAVGRPAIPNEAEFSNHLITDMEASFPMVANVVENVNGGPHLVGHPDTRVIYHWVAIRGYSEYSNKVHYVDSAYGGQGLQGFTLTQGNQRIAFHNMFLMIYHRGYVW